MNSRERVLAMIDGRPVDRIPFMPITMMFAADQIGVKYGQYVEDPKILAEAQVRTAERFGFDHVSGITDAPEVSDLGGAVRFFDDQPPALDESESLLIDRTKLAGLKVPDPLGGGRMLDRVRACQLMKEMTAGEKIVEGWIEGPCGQAANLRGINRLMLDFTDDSTFVRDLLDFIVELELRFARAEMEAGAELMGVGDPAASLVGPRIFSEFIVPAQRKLVSGLKAMGLRTRSHICGNTRRIQKERGNLGYDIVDVDTMAPLAEARAQMPKQVILGNVACVEVLRNGTPELVHETVAKCHEDAGALYIAAAGCEVPRDTPPANLHAIREYVQQHTAVPASGSRLPVA